MDEIFTADPAIKLCPSQAPQDANIAAYYHCIWHKKPHHCLKSVLEHLLYATSHNKAHNGP